MTFCHITLFILKLKGLFKIIKIIKNTIHKHNLIEPNDKIILGLSGGADSMFLLAMLLKLKNNYNLTIIPVHINHLVRLDECFDDEAFVKNYVCNLSLDYKIYRFDIIKFANKNKITIEESGRNIRYLYFEKVRKLFNANKIAIAHNKNDQAETVIMRFLRGTGLKGLTGIHYKNNNIIRPILDIDRNQIEEYCNKNNIPYIEDSSNKSIDYTRNKIRLELIPYILENFNANIINTLFAQTSLLASDEDYLEKQTHIYFNDCVVIKDYLTIDISKFMLYHISTKRRIIRMCIQKFNDNLKNITHINIDNIIELANKKTGKQICINNMTIIKEYSFIVFYNNNNICDGFCYKIDIGNFVYIKEINKYISINFCKLFNMNKLLNIYTKVYSYDTINDVLNLRTRQEGDQIYLKGINTYKKIKDIFINDKIPKLKRDSIPLLAIGNDVIWILDSFNRQSYFYQVNENTKQHFYVQIWEDNQ